MRFVCAPRVEFSSTSAQVSANFVRIWCGEASSNVRTYCSPGWWNENKLARGSTPCLSSSKSDLTVVIGAFLRPIVFDFWQAVVMRLKKRKIARHSSSCTKFLVSGEMEQNLMTFHF